MAADWWVFDLSWANQSAASALAGRKGSSLGRGPRDVTPEIWLPVLLACGRLGLQEEKSTAHNERKDSPVAFDFLLWSPRSRDNSTILIGCLFTPPSVGLAKQSQFLLLATKTKEKKKEEEEVGKNTRMKLFSRL